jgi:CVNH domain
MTKANASPWLFRPLLVLAAGVAIIAPVVADDAKAPDAQWGGSYARTCSDISVDKNGRLSATCRRMDGKSNRTNITHKECPSHKAANIDGKLVCEAQANAGNNGNGGNSDSGRWQGSFKQSCRDFSVNSDGTLTATCQARNGTWRPSSLARVNCTTNRAENDDGHLVCESQRVGLNRWEGSFEQTCRDIYMDASGTLTATCQSTNGEWNPTRLSARDCGSYTAANRNGQLVCAPRDTVGTNQWEGSFRQTCRDISVGADGRLSASCRARDGSWQRTTLAAVNCNGNRARNEDGQLRCESQRVGLNRWDGSFEKTCRDIYMDASGTLTATCRSMSGAWVPAKLSAKECASYMAANNDGRLVCEKQAALRQ